MLDQSRLWSWHEVASWLAARELLDPAEAERARFLAAVNAVLAGLRRDRFDATFGALEKRLDQALGIEA